VIAELRAAGADVPVVVGGIIPDADVAPLREAGVAAVYTPKDYDLTGMMSNVVDVIRKANHL
jgi:(2R)-ethylmalonyl-CoA mutase